MGTNNHIACRVGKRKNEYWGVVNCEQLATDLQQALKKICLLAVTLVLGLVSFPAASEGFKVKDLSDLPIDNAVFAKGAYIAEATSAKRVSIICVDCDDTTAIDVLLQRSDDGTEGRYRSGETTLKKMEEICQSRNKECVLSALTVGDAVGWVSSYQQLGQFGNTVILFLDGELLIIRSVAPTAEVAKENSDTAIAVIAHPIVTGEGGVAKMVGNVAKDDAIVSQAAFMEILKSGRLLCYEFSPEGTCDNVEVVDSYLSNGFSYHSWGMLSGDGHMTSLLLEVEWDGDLLCDKGEVIQAYLSKSPSNVAYVESFSEMLVNDEWRIELNEILNEYVGNVRRCYDFLRSKDTPQVMLQRLYLDGVLQDTDKFLNITTIAKGNGKVNVREPFIWTPPQLETIEEKQLP